MQRIPAVAVPLVTAAWIAALAGCSGRPQPTSPTRGVTSAVVRVSPDAGSGGARAFYPLELGNTWRYRHHGEAVIVLPSGERRPVFESNLRMLRELTCVEPIGGVDYVVERTTQRGPDATFQFWVRFRQDRTGLYEADVPTSEPASCEGGVAAIVREHLAAGTAPTAQREPLAAVDDPRLQAGIAAGLHTLETQLAAIHQVVGIDRAGASASGTVGELTRLRYPLHTGQRWVIRADPLYTARVEGHDVLRLEAGRLAGWRIRIDSELFGPGTRVNVWYGRSGFLLLRAHIEVDLGTDPSGEPAGLLVANEIETLVAFDLGERDLRDPTSDVMPLP